MYICNNLSLNMYYDMWNQTVFAKSLFKTYLRNEYYICEQSIFDVTFLRELNVSAARILCISISLFSFNFVPSGWNSRRRIFPLSHNRAYRSVVKFSFDTPMFVFAFLKKYFHFPEGKSGIKNIKKLRLWSRTVTYLGNNFSAAV